MEEYELSFVERAYVDYLGILNPTTYGLEDAWADGYVSVVQYYWNGHVHTQGKPVEVKGYFADDEKFHFEYEGKDYCLEDDFESCGF